MNSLHEQTSYSTSQVAAMLHVSRITVFRWIKEGTLKATKVGRNYVASKDEVFKHLSNKKKLPLNSRAAIKSLVDKVIVDYGETIRMLGQE